MGWIARHDDSTRRELFRRFAPRPGRGASWPTANANPLSIDAVNRLPLVVTVVVGTKGENVSRDYPTNVRVAPVDSGLPMETVFLCFQICSLDPQRFPPIPAGKLSGRIFEQVEQAVRYCLGL